MISMLSIAGLLGASSLFAQNNESIFEEARAEGVVDAPIPHDYMFFRFDSAISYKMNGKTVDQCYVEFTTGMTHTRQYKGQLETFCTSSSGNYSYGVIDVPSYASTSWELVVDSIGGDSKGSYNQRTSEKKMKKGLDTFVVDALGFSTGYWYAGFYTKIVFIDLNDGAWSGTSYSDIQAVFNNGKTGYVQECSDFLDHTSKKLGFVEIPKDGDKESMGTVPTQVTFRIGSSGSGTNITNTIDLKTYSTNVYKIGDVVGDHPSVNVESFNNYDVDFDENGHGNAPESQNLPYGDKVSTPENPQETGYTFAGWYKESACSNLWDFTNDVVMGDTTLYGGWTPITYTLSYTLNGGTISSANPTSYNIETTTFTLNNPTKSGYAFLGWTGSNGDVPERTVTIPQGSYGDRSYIANWRERAGFYFVGSETGWDSGGYVNENSIPLRQIGSTTEYTCRAYLTAENRGKIVYANSSGYIESWKDVTSVYTPMPDDYTIYLYDDGKSAKYMQTATYDLYYDDASGKQGNLSFNPIVTLTLKVDGETIGDLTRYDTDKGSAVSQFKYSGYTAVKNGVISIHLNNSESPMTVIRVDDQYNNIYSENSVLKFTNECSTDIYLKFYSGSRQLYQKGYAPNSNGVTTGSHFYVYDYTESWKVNDPVIFVKFKLPNNHSYDITAIAKCGSYDATNKVWMCTVPGVDAQTSATWTDVEVFRSPTGTETLDESNVWNKVTNLSPMNQPYYNGVKIKSAGDNNAEFILYSDAGMESGYGIYVDTSAAWGDWSVAGYGVYARFVGIVGGSSSAEEWVKLNEIPGKTKFYEGEVPQYNDEKVEWAGVQLVYATDVEEWSGQKKYESQFFGISSYNKGFQHFYFTGDYTTELQSEATADAAYTDDSRANDWGQRFIDPDIGVICYGGTKPPYIARWNAFQAEYNQMATEAKKIVTNAVANESGCYYEQAVARYDYICRKYNTKEEEIYEDYANREDAGKFTLSKVNNISLFDLLSDENNTSTIIIIVASSVSLLSITALSVLLVKKRKRYNINQ